MRRRIINYLDALFIGMLLGLIFVSVMHAAPLHRRGEVHASSDNLGSLLQKTMTDAVVENAHSVHRHKAD
jgi:hypothetical protein